MNILITAGGTTEKIDEVRSVTNTGTGRLGALIAERFAASDDVSHIFYVCAARSARPKGEKTEVRVADDTRALERAVRELCADRRIDAVIHGMAVSDYRVRTVSTSKDMARFIADAAPGGIGVPETERIARAIAETPSKPSNGKISSALEDLVIVMERAPKIISLFRQLLPRAILVGFKLLVNTSEDILVDTAYALLKKNRCDYVLANDLRDVRSDAHIGHLLDASGAYATYSGKSEIADGIVRAVLSHGKEAQK